MPYTNQNRCTFMVQSDESFHCPHPQIVGEAVAEAVLAERAMAEVRFEANIRARSDVFMARIDPLQEQLWLKDQQLNVNQSLSEQGIFRLLKRILYLLLSDMSTVDKTAYFAFLRLNYS